MPNVRLSQIMTMPAEKLTRYGDWQVSSGRLLIHRDVGSKILVVAHTDTVADALPQAQQLVVNRLSAAGEGPKLDDRLGVWAALKLLPRLGIIADTLLTDGEESGQSTAANFSPPRQYNWVVELDRRGEDVVTYQYQGKAWHRALRDAGFRVGRGTFSDIGVMEHLGVQCVNVGVGYHHEHSWYCTWHPQELLRQLGRLKIFYDKYKDRQFTFEPKPWIGDYDTSDWGSISGKYPYANRQLGGMGNSQLGAGTGRTVVGSHPPFTSEVKKHWWRNDD